MPESIINKVAACRFTAKFLRTSFTEHLRWLLLSKMWLGLQFSIFLVSSFIEDFLFFLFQQKREIKKGKSPDGVTIFTLFLSIDLFDVKDFKRILTDGNLIRKCVLKRIWCCSFHVYSNFAREWFLDGKQFTSSSTKTAQTINFKLSTHIFNRLLHKTISAFFLIMSCSFFIAIIWRVLKGYFSWKQWKNDYSKNVYKKKIAVTVLLFSWLATYQR